MKTIKKECHIMAPLNAVWDALVNPKTIDKWGGGPVKMSERKEKFSLRSNSTQKISSRVVFKRRSESRNTSYFYSNS